MHFIYATPLTLSNTFVYPQKMYKYIYFKNFKYSKLILYLSFTCLIKDTQDEVVNSFEIKIIDR